MFRRACVVHGGDVGVGVIDNQAVGFMSCTSPAVWLRLGQSLLVVIPSAESMSMFRHTLGP